MPQAGGGVLDAHRHDIFAYADAGRRFEDAAEVVFVVIEAGRDGVEAHVFGGVLEDVADHRLDAVVVAAVFRFTRLAVVPVICRQLTDRDQQLQEA